MHTSDSPRLRSPLPLVVLLVGLLVGVLLAPRTAREPKPAPLDERGLLAQLQRHSGWAAPVVDWSLRRAPGGEVYLVRYDFEPSWWGSWAVVGVDEGLRLDWVATVVGPSGAAFQLSEQSVESLRALRLEGHPNLFVEVVGTTHMGHGNVYLFELDALRRTLVLRLQAFALDRHDDRNRILGDGVLARDYADHDADGRADLTLSGDVRVRACVDGELVPGPGEVVRLRRVFHWSPAGFVESTAARRGVARAYPSRL